MGKRKAEGKELRQRGTAKDGVTRDWNEKKEKIANAALKKNLPQQKKDAGSMQKKERSEARFSAGIKLS